MKKLLLCLLFLLFAGFVFASDGGVISDYTRQKIDEFVTERIKLKSADEETALNSIEQIKNETLSHLKENALDYEQEECILQSIYFTEFYEHALNSKGNQKDLRDKMKKQMERNIKLIEKRSQNKISAWMYLVTGDVTSYYMTRSLTATFLYGFKVKSFYEKSIEQDKSFSSGYVNLGNWLFYAPGIFGGGKDKALKNYKKGIKYAVNPGEQYLAFIAYSQINYENKKKDVALEYLEKARALNLGSKGIDLIQRCNEKGYSNFQYLRNRSGIDDELEEE